MKELRFIVLCIGFGLITIIASAGVTDSSAYGFTIKQTIHVGTSPDSLFRAFLQVPKWWDSEHTFSGDAANLYIEPRAGGIFGEKLPNGGFVKHMEIAYLNPGSVIVLHGGLGPMLTMAVSASMQLAFTKDKDGTSLSMTYTVGGYSPGGLDKLARLVDTVLAQQFSRLKALFGPGSR